MERALAKLLAPAAPDNRSSSLHFVIRPRLQLPRLQATPKLWGVQNQPAHAKCLGSRRCWTIDARRRGQSLFAVGTAADMISAVEASVIAPDA
jgi:hypothetical protein